MKLLNIAKATALLALPFSILATTSADATIPRESQIHVTLLNCAANSGKASGVRAVVVADDSMREVAEQSLRSQAHWVTRDWNMNLPEGFYQLFISSGLCRDSILLPVLSGEDRDITAISKAAFVLSGKYAMVAGTLPIQGYAARIVYDPTTVTGAIPGRLIDYPAIVVGKAFYAVGLPRGKATLEIANSNSYWGTSIEFPIGIVGDSGIVLHITLSDLAREAAKPIPVVHPRPPDR